MATQFPNVLLLLTFLGSALGGLCRYAVAALAARCFGDRFPFGILVVNVTGAFVIGLVSGRAGAEMPLFSSFVLFGVLGGYTTVSTFTHNTLALFLLQKRRLALLNLSGSFVLCLAAVFAGAALARL